MAYRAFLLCSDKSCQRMDQLAAMAYLETDKPENIHFYERFGFTVVSEDTVVGVKNSFMQRPAGH